jgi:hypothetical protein
MSTVTANIHKVSTVRVGECIEPDEVELSALAVDGAAAVGDPTGTVVLLAPFDRATH